jgi:hypothetical protein
VQPGGPVGYLITVRNVGSAASGPTTVIAQVPGRVGLEYVTPPCAPIAEVISCPIDALQPGATASFTFGVTGDGGSGQIVVNAVVDPANAVVESNETNNTTSVTALVLPPPAAVAPDSPDAALSAGASLPPVPPVASLPEMTPASAADAQAPVDVAGIQVPPPVGQAGEVWLQIVAPTEVYSPDMEPMGTAEPGEWYLVTEMEDGWALTVWEGDTTASSVWIPMDDRVLSVAVDRPDPRLATSDDQ